VCGANISSSAVKEALWLQHYMVHSVATLAQADKDFRDTLAQLDNSVGEATANLAEGGCWYLEAVDLLDSLNKDVLLDISEELIRNTSDRSAPVRCPASTQGDIHFQRRCPAGGVCVTGHSCPHLCMVESFSTHASARIALLLPERPFLPEFPAL